MWTYQRVHNDDDLRPLSKQFQKNFYLFFFYTLLFGFFIRHRRPSLARCVVVYIFFRSFHFICRFEVNNKYTMIRCDDGREKQRRSETIRMTLSALHSMCSIYLLHFLPRFFLLFLLSFSFLVVFDEENSITGSRMTKEYNNRVVTALPTEATASFALHAKSAIVSTHQRQLGKRPAHGSPVLKLLIDKDSACFPKSSHRNPQTTIPFRSQQADGRR